MTERLIVRRRSRVRDLFATAAAYTASRWLTRRAPHRPHRTPADLGFAFESLSIATADGHRLAGWLIEPPSPRGTVAVFHGLRSNRERQLPRLAMLAEAGYRCVAFDHRAHGRSTGRKTSFGYHEAGDVEAVRELIRRRWPSDFTAAHGVSMGAAAICYAAARDVTWDAVVLEGLYRDVIAAFARRIGTQYPAWFAKLYPGIVRLTERRLRVSAEELSPVEVIDRLAPSPVFLLTGTADDLAPPSDAEQLYARYGGPCELWLVPGAGHSNVFDLGGLEYRRRVLAFLDRQQKN